MRENIPLEGLEAQVNLFAQESGFPTLSYVTTSQGQSTRPFKLTPEQVEEYSRLLDIYRKTQQIQRLKNINNWVKFFGILLIIELIAQLLF